MPRKRKKVVDETEEISLQDTQEYIVAGTAPEPDGVTEALDEPVLDEETELIDEPGFVEEEYEDDFYDEPSFYDEEIPEDEEIEAIALEPAEPKEPVVPISERAATIWAVVVAKAREVKLPERPKGEKKPDRPTDDVEPAANGKSGAGKSAEVKPSEGRSLDIDPKAAAGVAAIVLACLVVGIGAYLIGKGSGDDAGAASQEGETAGKQAGAIDGATKGYPAGFVKGRDAGFEKAYVRSYKLNYKRAFEQAGLDVPADKDIDVPEP